MEPQDGDGFATAAFDRLVDLERASFWFRGRTKLIDWAIARYFPDARDVLELGCGTGVVLEALSTSRPELRLSGAELHAGGLRHARKRVPRASLLQLDARKLPFANEFDLIGMFDVLEHIQEDEAVLREVHRSLRRGGGLVATVPQHPRLWSEFDEYAEHKRRYTRAELVSKLEAAGFRVHRTTSFVTALLPAMALSRAFERRRRRPFDPSREHVAAPRLSRALERILDAERLLIERGVDLPLGGSLFLVGGRP